MDSPLALVALGLFAVCAVLIVGQRETAVSPRRIAGIVAGLAGSGLLAVAGFLSGGTVLSWIGLVVWLVACSYAIVVISRTRRAAAIDRGEHR